MNSTEITETLRIAEPRTAAAPPAAPEFEHCDECGAPVDHLQRYCVNCGAHRRNIPDPAARYLAQATARTRARSVAGPSRAGVRRRANGVVIALALMVIVIAVGVGVAIGRSSNSSGAGKRSVVTHTKVSVVTHTKGTSSQGKQGTAATKSIQSATGKSYVKKSLSVPISVAP